MPDDAKEKTTLALQVEGKKPVIINDISLKECTRFLEKEYPDAAKRLIEEERRLDIIRSEVIKDPDKVIDFYNLMSGRARTDAYLAKQFTELGYEEIIKSIDEYHRFANLGSVIVWDEYEYHGTAKWLGSIWPNLKWRPYRFNDRASSARAYGGNLLFNRTWFRGDRLVLIGFPYANFPDFRDFGFDNRASSFAAIF